VDALASLDGDFVLNGELLVSDPQGNPHFKFYKAFSQSLPSSFFVFDLMIEMASCL
jgi:ATP-dependent DNA ligase